MGLKAICRVTDESNRSGLKRRKRRIRPGWLALVPACLLLLAGAVQAEKGLPTISRITVLADSAGIEVTLNGPVPFRAVLMEPREALIAFKGVRLSEKVRKDGENGEMIQQVKIDRLPNDVVSLTVTTTRDMQAVHPTWHERVNTMTARFAFIEPEKQPTNKAQDKAIEKPADLTDRPPKPTPPAASVPTDSLPASVVLEKNVLTGAMDDLPRIMAGEGCSGKIDIQEALRGCDRMDWYTVFQITDDGITGMKESACLEQAYYLRGYAFYKMKHHELGPFYLEALNYFQVALSYYPSSVYVPFALVGMGKIYSALKNNAEAKGYYKIVLDTHKEYSGRPEILYELGRMNAEDTKPELAVSIFNDFLTDYPDNRFAPDVQLGLGKALYDLNRYSDALAMLNTALAKDPRKAFESDQLLFLIGNCHYQLGQFAEARDALVKALNLFPKAETNPISLARIGDTYRDTGQPGKASRIYQLTMDTYPGTDGFIISAIRKAELLSGRTEKEQVLRMIIDGFPEHPMVRLAIVKLADLQLKTGEYRGCVETIRPLVLANVKELNEEAVFILQAAFKGLLAEMLKTDSYPDIILLHQKEKGVFRRFDSPDIFRMLGQAYLKGHLHAEAARLLAKAADMFGGSEPPELGYELAVALQESGQSEPALTVLKKYTQDVSAGEHIGDAFYRIGRILFSRGDIETSVPALQAACGQNLPVPLKTKTLRLLSEAHRLMGRDDQAIDMLISAAELLTASAEKDMQMLTDTFQQLGETHMRVKAYDKAAEAFASALKYCDETRSPGILVQLGEAYRNAGDRDQAKKMYDQVLTLEDGFWKYQAQERLRRMVIEQKIYADGA